MSHSEEEDLPRASDNHLPHAVNMSDSGNDEEDGDKQQSV